MFFGLFHNKISFSNIGSIFSLVQQKVERLSRYRTGS
jgi:hypothetical protein